jgi:hypothetical protein
MEKANFLFESQITRPRKSWSQLVLSLRLIKKDFTLEA